MKRSRRLLALMMALALFCTGCSLDVESFLQPPRIQGEQQAVQQALETYIRDSEDTGSGLYTLKYPTEGEYTSAFLLCDGQGRPLEEDVAVAQFAVAFYARSSAPDETHVNLLRRSNEEWISVGDSVGSGVDIRQVAFGDLDGDGMGELLTGWSTYNSRDHRLAVFSLVDGLTLLADDRLYSGLYVGDMTATGQDSVLLLHIGSGNTVTATLTELREGRLHTLGSAPLDGYIQQFGSMTLCQLAEGVHGLYVDAYKSSNTTITELIYYDDIGLHVPFYDPNTNVTTVTGRATGLAARDIDADGRVEIPVSYRLSAASEEEHITDYLTSWRSWDYATGTWSDRMKTVVNLTDNYLVILDETQIEGLATIYMEDTRTLDLLRADTGRVWLRLCADQEERTAPQEGMKSLRLFEDVEGATACWAWYHPDELDAEKVRYMVLCLAQEGG